MKWENFVGSPVGSWTTGDKRLQVKLQSQRIARPWHAAPPLREAQNDAKDALRKLVCSQERMHELQAMPAQQLSLPEFCIMRVHQETATMRDELGAWGLSLTSA